MSALLMLCIDAMAFVNLNGCERGLVESSKAKDRPLLRQEIKTRLGFELEDADIIAGFMVHDKDFTEVDNVFFAGRQKDEKAVTFIYGPTEMRRIHYSMYYQYLGCEVHDDE